MPDSALSAAPHPGARSEASASAALPHHNAVTLIRWFFALSLVCFHACLITGRPIFSPVKGHAIVSVFFTLSGMLTFEGFMRHPGARSFYRRRLLRIFPPYAIVIVLSVILLAPLSTLPAADYFHSGATWRYLASNITFLNFLSPTLPGLFGGNLIHAVNSSLWTMKVEVAFYIVLPLIALAARRWRPAAVVAALYLLSVAYYLSMTHLALSTGLERYAMLRRQLPGELMYFAAGMGAALLRRRILEHPLPLLIAGVVIWAVAAVLTNLRPVEPVGVALTLTVAAYSSRRLADISVRVPNLTYEVFLIHFPLLQSLVALGLFSALGFVPAFLIALACILILAALLHRLCRAIAA